MTDALPLSLHRKLAQVMYEAERIPKRGKAPAAMGGFAFVQVGDAADYIRKALAEKVISMVPSQVEVIGETEHETKSGGTMTTLELRVTWTLTDGESGESAVIQSFGAGADTGDKYSGKAMTNAMKYALLAGFLLSTGDDVELSDVSDRANAAPSNSKKLAANQSAARSDGLVGRARVGDRLTSDGELRESMRGPDEEPLDEPISRLGFRLEPREGDRGAILVEAWGELALALALSPEAWRDQPVTAWGTIKERSFAKGKTDIKYQALVLSRIQTPTGMIPAVEGGPEQAPEAQAADDAASSGTTLTTTDPAPTAKDAHDEDPAIPVAADAAAASSESAPQNPADSQCDSASPYGDNERCELLEGHRGPHKVLSLAFPETWTDR